ncbi:MAG: signal peptidase I [Mariprofundaceae bacterium]
MQIKHLPFKYAKTIRRIIFGLVVVIIGIVCIRSSIINVAWITSGSMLPNHAVNSRIVSNQLAWGLNLPFMQQQIMQWRQPQRGDIVLFHNPNDAGNLWMKRVIGLPGDSIEFRKHQLYVNARRCTLEQRNQEHVPRENCGFSPAYHLWSSYLEKDWGPILVPEGELFLLGDNRGASLDSRRWGAISTRYLSGRAFLRIWPPSAMAWLP